MPPAEEDVQDLADQAAARVEQMAQDIRRAHLDAEFRIAQQLVETKNRWTRVGRHCSQCKKLRCERPQSSVLDTQGGDIFISRNQWGKQNRRCEKCLEDEREREREMRERAR